MYFNASRAFSSAKELFFTMGHELVHVSQIAALAGQSGSLVTESFRNMMEFQAYSYEAFLGRETLNSFTPAEISSWAKNFSKWFKSLHFMSFNWTRNYSFTYPFN